MNTDQANNSYDAAHSASADKAKGRAKEWSGTAKDKIGGVIGDHELQAKGQAQNAEGKTDRMKGEIKEKIGDAKNIFKAGVGAMKDKFNELRR